MKLTKKHIGQLFDCGGSDGSWCYQLIAIKEKNLLFYVPGGDYEIDTNKYADWRPFVPQSFPQEWIEYGWKTARRAK